MGNRAVITTKGSRKGIYIHWNGGRDSVEPILWATKNLVANKVAMAHNELENIAYTLDAVGFNPEIGKLNELDCDNYDNGLYITNNYEIIGRKYLRGGEQKEYNFLEFVKFINEQLPQRLKREENELLMLLASVIPSYSVNGKIKKEDYIKNLNVGDIIYYKDTFYTLIGRAEKDKVVNGSDIKKGELFFNYTQHYKPTSYGDFRISNDNLEHLSNNPNSYVHFDWQTNDAEFKVVNMALYKQLKEEWENLPTE